MSDDNELKNKVAEFLVGKESVPLTIIGQKFPRAQSCTLTLSRVLGNDTRFSLGLNNTMVSLSRTMPVKNSTEFTLVSTKTEAVRIVRECIMRAPQIMVDLEGDLNATGRMSLLTIEAAGQVFLFDVLALVSI